MQSIKPILDKVVVEVEVEKKDRSAGGIILAGNSKEQALTAVVVARGPGGMIDGREGRMYLNQGDTVLIPKNCGTSFTLNGKEYIVLSQSEVLAIIG